MSPASVLGVSPDVLRMSTARVPAYVDRVHLAYVDREGLLRGSGRRSLCGERLGHLVIHRRQMSATQTGSPVGLFSNPVDLR